MVYTVSDNAEVAPDGESPKVWKQLCLTFLASIPYFTHGVETTILSTSFHPGHFVSTPDQVPWTTLALILAAGVSAPLFSYLVDSWGRKLGIYVVNLLQAASCVPLFLPESEVSLIILHILAGTASGGMFTVLPTYVKEVSYFSPGLQLCWMAIMVTGGYLVQLVADKETTMFVMVGVIAAQVLISVVLVESPAYLVMKGKVDLARKNLALLFRLPEENEHVLNAMTSLQEESDRAAVGGKLQLYRILKNEIYRNITKIGITLNIVVVLGGSIAFLDQDKVLAQLRMASELDKHMLLGCMFCGSLTCMALVHFAEKKYLLTFGFFLMVVSLGVLAVYTQRDLTIYSLRWVPIASLGVLVFAFGVTWGLPFITMAELYTFKIRATMLGVLYTFYQIIKLIHVYTFPYIEDYMGLYTVLYIFSGVNLTGGVYSAFGIPELKGKTLRQIEKQFRKVPILRFSTKPRKM